jgi:hypothetical protein
MRKVPTALEQSGTINDYALNYSTGVVVCTALPLLYNASLDSAQTQFTIASVSGISGWGGYARQNSSGSSCYLGWSAEL